MSGEAKKPAGSAAPSPFERTVTLDPDAPPPRRTTAVLTPEAQVMGASALPLPEAHALPVTPSTPSSSGVHPRGSTLVIEPKPSAVPSAPTFGAPPPAPPARKNPLEGMSFTGTAVVDDDPEVRRARERLRIGDARATQLGMARLSAATEAPTSTRAPFRITPPSPESDRESRPTLPPWMEAPQVKATPMRHPLERTQETSPLADVFEKVVPGLAPTPSGEEVWRPPPPAPGQAAGETLTSPVAAPRPPAVRDDAYRPAGTPIVGPPPGADPSASPYGRDLPLEPPPEAPAARPPEPPRERKSVTAGLYSKFGKK